MAGPSRRPRLIGRRLAQRALVLGLLLAGTAGSMASEACQLRELGAFSLCVPPAWRLEATAGTAVDSAAGRWSVGGPGAALLIEHDFGLYSDPLKDLPEGARVLAETALQVEGRAARLLRYTAPGREGEPAMHLLGLHVPVVHPGGRMGPIRLTLLARSTDPKRLDEVDAVFRSLRFKPPR